MRKNWVLVAGTTVVLSVAATFFTFGQTRIYEARAVIMFDPSAVQPLGQIIDTTTQYWNNKEYYKTQLWILRSQRTAQAVVTSLNLNKDAAFVDNAPPGAVRAPKEVTVEQAGLRLASSLFVDPIKDSRLAEVRFQDADPDRAQRLLSAVVDTYVQSNLDDITLASHNSSEWLHDQVTTLKKDLDSSEEALFDYKKDKSILSVSMDDQSAILRSEIEQLNTAVTSVRAEEQQVLSRKAELAKVVPEDPTNIPVTELLTNPMLGQLRSQYEEARRSVNGLKALGKGDEHPEVRAGSAQVEATRAAMMAEITNLQKAMDGNITALREQQKGVLKLVGSAQQRALDLNQLQIEYNRLLRTKENNEKLFTLVMERSKESDLTKMLRINNLRVVERPRVNKTPVSPNAPLNIAAGLLAGLVLGLAAAVGREQLDRSIKTPEDAERELRSAFLGLLPSTSDDGPSARPGKKNGEVGPSEANTASELVVHEHPTSGIAEAARAIRTNVLLMSPDRPLRTILITSAGPAEGKTTVACCLATAMAQAGRRVVLLDCDMRRPRLHRVFGLTKDTGLTTALLDPTSVANLAVPTVVPNLSVVTTGPLPPNPAEILHSEAFAKLLDTLRERFDCVIIDSPPVVPVTDATILSSMVDGTILVVRAFKTSKDLAHRAARHLRDIDGHLVGTVLNAVDLDRHSYGYKYYYYYKREGYQADDVPGARGSSPPVAPS